MLRRDPLANPGPLIERVYAYVAYRVGDGHDAEDITSATLERALRYKDSFDVRKGEPVGWLIGIARREIATHFGDTDYSIEDVPEMQAPGDLSLDSVNRLDLRKAVAALEPRDRELVALRYGADLSAKRIAALFDVKTNAIEVALHRALRRLRDRLEPESQPARPARRNEEATAL
jgi:RNA polymerase sigma-70 factor (ECF subfamily)